MKPEDLGAGLLRALAELPDPGSRHGRRHPVPAVLALSTGAMLCGARSLRSLYAIAQWGREQPETVGRALGFTRVQTPGVATLHQVCKALDVEACKALDVEACKAALAAWAPTALGARSRAGQVIAIDGKALRGIPGEELRGITRSALGRSV